MDRQEQFRRAARTWENQNPGSSVWVTSRGGYFEVRVDNPPAGFGFDRGTPEEFFKRIGGKLAPPPRFMTPQTPPPLRFTYKEYRAASKAYGANCGYGAMAAVLGITLDDVRRMFPDGGIGRSEMEDAINRAGWRCRQIGANLPTYGVAVVEFDGPNGSQGHWIAVCGDKIVDSYSIAEHKGWYDADKWFAKVGPKVAKYYPGTTGKCWTALGLEVEERS